MRQGVELIEQVIRGGCERFELSMRYRLTAEFSPVKQGDYLGSQGITLRAEGD